MVTFIQIRLHDASPEFYVIHRNVFAFGHPAQESNYNQMSYDPKHFYTFSEISFIK